MATADPTLRNQNVSSTITVRAGWIIDGLDVDGSNFGGPGGNPNVIELGPKETVTAVEYGFWPARIGFWPTGTMCSLKIYTNFNNYGPYSERDRCSDIKKIFVPFDMSFEQFMKKYAEETNDGSWGGSVLTINRDDPIS